MHLCNSNWVLRTGRKAKPSFMQRSFKWPHSRLCAKRTNVNNDNIDDSEKDDQKQALIANLGAAILFLCIFCDCINYSRINIIIIRIKYALFLFVRSFVHWFVCLFGWLVVSMQRCKSISNKRGTTSEPLERATKKEWLRDLNIERLIIIIMCVVYAILNYRTEHKADQTNDINGHLTCAKLLYSPV